MTHTAETIARRLMLEHEAGAQFQPLAAADGISSVAEAYEVQQRFVNLLKEKSGEAVGYKIGLTTARMQQMCGIESPVAGVVLAGGVHHSGVVLTMHDYCRLGLEFEIGVRIGHDLAHGSAPHTVDSVGEAVSGICAAVEMIDDRNADYAKLDALSLIADNSWNAGIVLGDWHDRLTSLPDAQARIYENGVEVDTGFGRDVLGHPFAPLAWLANHLNQGGGGLKAGDVVLTGSLVVTRFPTEASVYRYDLNGLGSVEIPVTE